MGRRDPSDLVSIATHFISDDRLLLLQTIHDLDELMAKQVAEMVHLEKEGLFPQLGQSVVLSHNHFIHHEHFQPAIKTQGSVLKIAVAKGSDLYANHTIPKSLLGRAIVFLAMQSFPFLKFLEDNIFCS